MKEVKMMSEKDEKLEFIELYEKYLNLTSANRTLVLGMIIGLQYGQTMNNGTIKKEAEKQNHGK